MNFEQYMEQRNQLMNEAEQLIGEQKFEDSEAKIQEVKDLDNSFEEIKNKQADLESLKDNTQVTDLNNQSETVKGGNLMGELDNTNQAGQEVSYKQAWAKTMMNQTLTAEETQVFNQVNGGIDNAYTHDTSNTGVLIPETVAQGIFGRAEEEFPFYADVKKFGVEGHLTLKKHEAINAGDAEWYDEDEETAQEENEFGELTLHGKELSKAVTVSWKLQAMAMDEFIDYIMDELGKRVGKALGTSAVQGKGNKDAEGAITALEAQSQTPQIVEYSDGIDYQDVTTAMSKVHSTYLDGASIYANNATIWNELANIVDGNGRPIFIPDASASGVGRLFGKPVKADAGVPDDAVVIGNPNDGMVFNINKDFEIVTEQHARQRKTDYVAYALVDGGVLDEQAFAVIKKNQV